MFKRDGGEDTRSPLRLSFTIFIRPQHEKRNRDTTICKIGRTALMGCGYLCIEECDKDLLQLVRNITRKIAKSN